MAVNELGRYVTATLTEQGIRVLGVEDETGRRAFVGVGTQTVSPGLIGGAGAFPGYAEGYSGAGSASLVFTPAFTFAQLSIPLITSTGTPLSPTVSGGGLNTVTAPYISSVGTVFSPSVLPAGVEIPRVPTLLVEFDPGGYISGAVLDDPVSAELDAAVLGPTAPTFPIDISEYVRAASTGRGAQRELQRIEAGTGEITLDNRDSRFTPFDPDSPYFPDVLPMRRIRILGTWEGITYPVFYGFVESWPVVFPGDVDMEVTVSLVDGFKVLAQAFVSGDFEEQGSGTRIEAILDAVGWSADERDIDVGVATIPAATLENVSALEHLQQVAHAEGGRFFIGRDGFAVFRQDIEVNPDVSNRRWADDGSGMSYRDVVIACDDELILNDVHLTREGGVEQIATDLDSQTEFGIRSSSEQNILLASDSAVLARAELQITRYANPVLRLNQLVDNAMQHLFWDRVLDRDITDVAVVIESRTETEQTSSIEGISHDIGRDGTWTVTLAVAPSQIINAGVLDDPTYGLLDSTAILA